MIKISDWSQIPELPDERAEAEFWAAHQLEIRLMNSALQRPDVRESTTRESEWWQNGQCTPSLRSWLLAGADAARTSSGARGRSSHEIWPKT